LLQPLLIWHGRGELLPILFDLIPAAVIDPEHPLWAVQWIIASAKSNGESTALFIFGDPLRPTARIKAMKVLWPRQITSRGETI
jgi:hypothetical protein